MKIGYKIQQQRMYHQYSQEQLAEQLQVTRQTISNWENNKSYPDIHYLLTMSKLFSITLDDLIKEDLPQIMTEIEQYDRHKFKKQSTIFTILLILTVVSSIPLTIFYHWVGALIWLIFMVIPSCYYAHIVEKNKHQHNIQTLKEINSFVNNKKLTHVEKIEETAKAPYQKCIIVFACIIIKLLTSTIMLLFLKPFI